MRGSSREEQCDGDQLPTALKGAKRKDEHSMLQPMPVPSEQFEAIFASFPDAVVVCDLAGTVLRLNATARRLFEVPSERHWQGKPVLQVFGGYTLSDEQHRGMALSSWFENLSLDKATLNRGGEHTILLSVPSGRKVFLDLRSSRLFDVQEQPMGIVLVFHEISPRYQRALHLQRVQEAVQALTAALDQIPPDLDFTFSQETPLLSPPVLFVAKPLVDVIRQV